jgi:hypothetical protein
MFRTQSCLKLLFFSDPNVKSEHRMIKPVLERAQFCTFAQIYKFFQKQFAQMPELKQI